MEILRAVAALPTAPFHESAVARYVLAWAQGLGLRVGRDRHDNILATHRRGRPGTHWVLVAHMDHPGFVAQRQRGRTVWGRFHGGVAMHYFPGSAMVWLTDAGSVRGQVDRVGSRDGRLGCHEVRVRLAGPAAVPPGTMGMWDLPAVRVRGSVLHGRACDDLAGLAVAMCAVERFVHADTPGTLSLLATRGEEAGFVGALGAVHSRLVERRAVLVSVECSSAAGGCVRQGGGVVVRVGDRASLFDPRITATLSSLAEDLARRDEGFRWQRALMAGGTCEASAFAPHGYTVGAVCLPLGNYHNQGRRSIAAETIHLDDFTAAVTLLAALPGQGPQPKQTALRARLDEIWAHRRGLLGKLEP